MSILHSPRSPCGPCLAFQAGPKSLFSTTGPSPNPRAAVAPGPWATLRAGQRRTTTSVLRLCSRPESKTVSRAAHEAPAVAQMETASGRELACRFCNPVLGRFMLLPVCSGYPSGHAAIRYSLWRSDLLPSKSFISYMSRSPTRSMSRARLSSTSA